MSDPIISIDLSGFQLTSEEAAHLSKTANDAVMAEFARLSKTKGPGVHVESLLPGKPHIIGIVANVRLNK